MNEAAGVSGASRGGFDRLLGEIRPKLHRYCSRMTGSVIDGEDVVQDALIKAIEAFPAAGLIVNSEAWLFRIAHNVSLDYLRRRARLALVHSDQDPDTIIDPVVVIQDREIAAAGLRTFMRLPVAQRSSVILMDVLGYSLEEIGNVIGATVPSVKAALHRGRARLRELSMEPVDARVPMLTARQRRLLRAYVDLFNARKVDGVRAMLGEEVRLDLVARHKVAGKTEVSKYLGMYRKLRDWRFVPGFVDGRTAALVCDLANPLGEPIYFVVLDWSIDGLISIRDFRYARYAIDRAEMIVL
jgi:RNA polymerase sigma-70 factor (ECF subfamily)